MSINAPSHKFITAGQLFHGYKRADGKFEDLYGFEFDIPVGAAFSAGDGAWSEIDFGLPDIDGVSSKAILTKWNGYAREWNSFRGASSFQVQIAQNAWLYRSVAGITWVLWVDTPTWEIRAHRVYEPELYYPSSAHAYLVVGNIPTLNHVVDMAPIYAPGYNLSCTWVNQSKTGKRAAIHRYAKDASGFNMPSSIVEVIVGDNGGDSPPFVDVASYTKGVVREETTMPRSNYWSVDFNTVEWNTYDDYVDIYWAPHSFEVDNGTAKDYTTYSYVIVYDDNESPQCLQHQIRTDYVSTATPLGNSLGDGHYAGTITGMSGVVPEQSPNCTLFSLKETKEWFSINGKTICQLGHTYTETSSGTLEPLATNITVTGGSSEDSQVYDRVIPLHGKSLIAVPVSDSTATEYVVPTYTSSATAPVPVRGFLSSKKSRYDSSSPINIIFSDMCFDYSGALNPAITRRF